MPLNNVNLTQGAPLDIQAQQQMLAQQQQIAQALIVKSLQEHSPVVHTGGGNQFARDVPNFGDPVSDIAQAYYGNKRMGEVNQQQGELADRTQRMTERDIAEALAARQGMPAIPGGPEDGGHAATSPDYNKFVQVLMKSQVPRVQAMGAEAMKGMPTPEKLLEHGSKYAGGSAANLYTSGDPNALTPKPEVQSFEGSARKTVDGVPIGPAFPINSYDPMAKNSLGIASQKSEVTGRETAAGPQGDISTQKSFDNLDAAAQVKMVEDGAKQYVVNGQNLATLNQVKADMKRVPENEFGFAGTFRTTLGKVGEALGLDKLYPTSGKEVISAALGNINLQKVRALAPVTETDLAEIKKIVGDQGMTKRSLEQVIGIMEASAHAEMAKHAKQVAVVAQRSSNPDQFRQAYMPEIVQPAIPPAGGGPYQGMSDADIMKKLRGR